MPKISVIMSVYNGEKYLAEAIESIVGQTFSQWELVIINDCSQDSTGEILEKYSSSDERIKVYTNEMNLKLPKSLNKAISLCSGKYIARMDADDICLPDRFEKQYKFMEENDDISLSSCRFLTLKNGVYSSGSCGARCDYDSLKAMLLVTNPILHPGVIAKAEVMKALNYDTSLTCTEDLELWNRMVRENIKMEIQPEYLLIYRLHDKQITKTTLEKQQNEVLKIQNNYFSDYLNPLDEEMQNFYVSGIYFNEKPDINKFCTFMKMIKSVNKNKKTLETDALNYALLEVLAEYKRCGIPKFDIITTMLNFDFPFLIKEILRRKKTAKLDGASCIRAAQKIGLHNAAGNKEFPMYSKN